MQSLVLLGPIFSGCSLGTPGLTQQYDLRPDGDLSYPMGNVTATIVRGTQGGEVQVGSESLSPIPR